MRDVLSLQFIHVRDDANPFGPVSYPEFTDYRERTRAFIDIAAFPYSISTAEVTTSDRREHVLLTQGVDHYFPVLGIDAVQGTLAFDAAQRQRTPTRRSIARVVCGRGSATIQTS